MSSNPLHLLMNPKSIAVAGASNNPMKMGTLQALSIIKDGYQGKFYPLHPREREVLGHRAYASVFDLPEAPDLALFIVPARQVVPLLEDFGKIGTRRAVIISAGFRETGPEGRQLEEELKETARRYGIRFLGPNCMGMLNTRISLNVTVMAYRVPPGKLGIASQSGTYITQTLPYLRERGIRLSKAISVGNEADIDIVDALEYLGEDEDTRAISLYIEGIKDPRRFIESARRITPHKPVLAQYVGGTEAGARAGRSHTGAMAGPDYLYEGLFKQAGVIRVSSVEELYAFGWALATQPPLRGRRIAVITNSGGPGTAMSHTLDAGGLEVPPFSPGLQEQIRAHIPPHAASSNPVDLTFHMETEILSETIPELIMKSGEVDGVVLHGAMGHGFMRAVFPHIQEMMGGMELEQFLESIQQPDLARSVELPRRYNLPLIVSSFLGRSDNYNLAYQEHDIPVLDSPEKAARAMVALLRHKEIRERERDDLPPLPAVSPRAAELINRFLEQGRLTLDEYSSKQVLAAYGIPVPREQLAETEAESVEAAKAIGFPVVLKGCSPEIIHKTERNLVHLGLQDSAAVSAAFHRIQEAAGSPIPVLVAETVSGRRELMAGALRHPGFGPCVLLGLGGIFTEALRDNTFRLAPLRFSEALEMCRDLRGRGILEAVRGMPRVDTGRLAVILQILGQVMLLHPQIAEIDLNPILISGSRPVAVDALLVLESRGREEEKGG